MPITAGCTSITLDLLLGIIRVTFKFQFPQRLRDRFCSRHEHHGVATKSRGGLPTTINSEAKMEGLQQELQGMVDGAILVEDEETAEQE